MFLMPMHREGKGVEGRCEFVARATLEITTPTFDNFTPEKIVLAGVLIALGTLNSRGSRKNSPWGGTARIIAVDIHLNRHVRWWGDWHEGEELVGWVKKR